MRPVLIIFDMAKGYGRQSRSLGYDIVAMASKLKNTAYAANVQDDSYQQFATTDRLYIRIWQHDGRH